MLPNIEQENTKKGAQKLTPEQRDEILVKVLASVSTESMKSVSDTSVARIVTDFATSIELANKDLVENLVDEDKTLLKDVVKEISKLQGKNSEELKRLAELAEKIMLSADKSGNEQLKSVGERLKESVLQEKFQDANATLTGDQDTFKNRFMRNVTGKTPAEAKVQGTSIFGSVLKDFSYGFRKGLGGLGALLNNDRVLCHPLIVLELSCGSPPAPRKRTLQYLSALQTASIATIDETINFVELNKLYDCGCGAVDMALLASTRVSLSAFVSSTKKSSPAVTRGRMTSSRISSNSVRPRRGSHNITTARKLGRVMR